MTDKKPSGGVREYRKYRDGLYIPHRYILYSYWFQFLKIGYEEKRKIDWKKYKDWGTPEELFSQSFRTFWEKNWKRLFSEQTSKGRTGKFIMTSERTKPDAIKTTLVLYKFKNKYPDKTNPQIVSEIENQKIKPPNMKRFKSYQNLGSLFGGKTTQDTKEINRGFKRYIKQFEEIMQNVCEGRFP